MQFAVVICAAMAVVNAAPLPGSSTGVVQEEFTVDCSLGPAIPCTLEYAPVCASNGSESVTFGNKCAFKAAQCTDPELQLVAEGECEVLTTTVDCSLAPDIPCTYEYDPVCVSDGVSTYTYGNKCAFKAAQCTNANLTMVAQGECASELTAAETTEPDVDCSQAPDIQCTREYHPVCASNGEVFGNPCMFKVAQCTNADLTIVAEGAECEAREVESAVNQVAA